MLSRGTGVTDSFRETVKKGDADTAVICSFRSGTVPADGRLSVSESKSEEVLGSRKGTGVGETGRAPGTILGLKTLARGAPKESEAKVQ